jgi:hypothetical protein
MADYRVGECIIIIIIIIIIINNEDEVGGACSPNWGKEKLV